MLILLCSIFLSDIFNRKPVLNFELIFESKLARTVCLAKPDDSMTPSSFHLLNETLKLDFFEF